MPEKPEVITVVKKLKLSLINQTIHQCNVYWNNIIAYPTTDQFKKQIVGQTIHDITTRGKFIVIDLDFDVLLIHLRMEGKFLFRSIDCDVTKHEHVEFILNEGVSLRYHDVRKFGKMYLLPKGEVYSRKPLSDLGLEYNDSNLTSDYLLKKFKNKNLPIKSVLLDQSIIAGIGNIYDDEILYLCHINPLEKACTLTKKDCEHIIHYTKEVLNHAIELGGTTIKSFTSSEGVHGLFQNELLVHGKQGAACSSCGSIIKKIQVNGRGTYFCPKCQNIKK